MRDVPLFEVGDAAVAAAAAVVVIDWLMAGFGNFCLFLFFLF